MIPLRFNAKHSTQSMLSISSIRLNFNVTQLFGLPFRRYIYKYNLLSEKCSPIRCLQVVTFNAIFWKILGNDQCFSIYSFFRNLRPWLMQFLWSNILSVRKTLPYVKELVIISHGISGYSEIATGRHTLTFQWKNIFIFQKFKRSNFSRILLWIKRNASLNNRNHSENSSKPYYLEFFTKHLC